MSDESQAPRPDSKPEKPIQIHPSIQFRIWNLLKRKCGQFLQRIHRLEDSLKVELLTSCMSSCVIVLVALLGGAGYLLTRLVENRSAHEDLSLKQAQIAIESSCLEHYANLANQPPEAIALLTQGIDSVCDADAVERYRAAILSARDPILCVVSAELGTVRAEGITELLPPIGLLFFPASYSEKQPVEAVDIEITFGVNVTNMLSGKRLQGVALRSSRSAESQGEPYAELVADNKITFRNVVLKNLLDDPMLTISGLRVNASQLHRPPEDGDATAPLNAVQALIAVSNPSKNGPFVEVRNELPVLARAYLGLISQGNEAVVSLEPAGSDDGKTPVHIGSLEVREGFPGAFTDDDIPRVTSSGNTIEERSGHRLLLRFFNVPEGLDLLVQSVGTGREPNSRLTLLTEGKSDSPVSTQEGRSQVSQATSPLPIPVENGLATTTWALRHSSAGTAVVSATIEAYAAISDRGAATGVVQASASFAPVSTVMVASETAPIPRFLDTSGAPKTIGVIFAGSEDEGP